jgi:hypothetical protein
VRGEFRVRGFCSAVPKFGLVTGLPSDGAGTARTAPCPHHAGASARAYYLARFFLAAAFRLLGWPTLIRLMILPLKRMSTSSY